MTFSLGQRKFVRAEQPKRSFASPTMSEAGSGSSQFTVIKADHANPVHATAIETLIAEYALDPMCGGEAKISGLIPNWRKGRLHTPSWHFGQRRRPSGSATALKGTQRSGSPQNGRPARHMCDARSESQRIVLSGKTLVNIHDCAVTKDFRGKVKSVISHAMAVPDTGCNAPGRGPAATGRG